MSAIVTSPSVVRPIDLIRQAIGWCQLRGIRVSLGDYGIECGSSYDRLGWRVTPARGACDPLGAVVLMRQPAARHLPDAVAEALGVSMAWAEGAAAGLDKQAPSGGWLRSMRRQDYLLGFECGTQLRIALLSAVCAPHNQRFRRTDGCPMCLEDELARLDREST